MENITDNKFKYDEYYKVTIMIILEATMYPNDVPTDDEENLEKLSQDNTPPAAPASPGNTDEDLRPSLSADDPNKDTNIQPEEAYDVGLDAASGAAPPSESDVVAFHPPEQASEDDEENIEP